MFLYYPYGFYLVKIWINKEIYNDSFKAPYNVGDAFSIVEGVFYGMLAIGSLTSNLSIVI